MQLRRMLPLLFALLPASLFAQAAPLPVTDCIQHAVQAKTSGLKSTNYQQGIVPSCTVTVYLTGTQTPAALFKDGAGTPLANPFTANTDGSISPIYAATNQAYDVVLSGGIEPNVYSSPVTITDVGAGGGSGGGSIPATGNVLKGTGTAGTATGAIPGGDYLSPNLDNGLNAHGFATSTANQNSYTWFQTGDVWNGAAAVPIFYGQQVIVGTGVNANSILNFNCSSPGPCAADFNYPVSSTNNLPAGDKSAALASGLNVFQNVPAVPAQYFGAKGDAYLPPNGCSTTVSSANVTCVDGPFVAGDVGKQVWVQGAGTGGVAFHGTITTVVSSTVVTTNATASIAVANGYGVYGTDDVTAIQACLQYSASNQVTCTLRPLPAPGGGYGQVGFLIGSGSLQLVNNNYLEENAGESLIGTSGVKGTNLFCEFNGDCLTLAAGGIQGVFLSRLEFQEDPTQPASRAMNFTPSAGIYGGGELSSGRFEEIQVDNPALECLLMNGGGGPGYTYNLPNQYLTFINFQCNGPNQSHPANLIKMQGQAAQILFLNGQVQGSNTANYPNYQININEKTSTLGDTPVDVKFIGYTLQVGQKGIYAGNGSNNIHFDSGYVEDITNTVFGLLNSPGFTFNGNHVASSAYAGGAVGIGNLLGGSTASIRDIWVYGNAPAALAVCSGSNNSIDFAADVAQAETTNLLTTNCATATASTTGGALTIGQGATTASISCSGAAISALAAPGVQPGKTLTLYAPSSGCQLASGGNIAFGNYTAPVTIPAGGSATLTLLDSGVTFLVTDAPPPGAGSSNWSSIVHGTNTDFGAFSTDGQWTFNQGVYFNSSSGAVPVQFGPGTTPGSSSTCVSDDGNFHIDGTCNGNRAIYLSGNSAGTIVGFRPTYGGSVVASVKTDGSMALGGAGLNTPSVTVSGLAPGTSPVCPNGAGGALTTSGCGTSAGVSSLNTQTGPQSIVGDSTLTVTPNGTNQVALHVNGTAGSGTVVSSPSQSFGGFPSPGGTTIGNAPNFYWISPSNTQAQINALLSGLSGTNSVFIPAGAPQVGYTANGQVPHDFRLGADWFQMPGAACDGKQSALTITITSGSNTSSVGSLLSAADVGKTFFFAVKSGFSFGFTQSVWTATLSSYTFPTATWSANAPFSETAEVYYGTDNFAAITAAMAQANSIFPLTIPTGCKMLVNGTIAWNNSQVIVGRHLNAGGFIGVPGEDVIATTDTSGQSISTPGVGLKGFALVVGSDVDATFPINYYSANGTLTAQAALYRPAQTHTPNANNPCGPGWMVGCIVSVGSITDASTSMTVPTGVKLPAVGNTIVFPYLTSVFTTTVTAVNTGTGVVTLNAAAPTGSTATQAEFFAGTSVQTTTTTIPGTPTYPFTLQLSNAIKPVPGFVSNFAQWGHAKIGSYEFDYMGANFANNTIVVRRGPASVNGGAGYSGTNTIVALNPCPAKFDNPWPVTPSINSGDSTPSGANWFPGQCVGNAGLAFPSANGNVFVGGGLTDGFLEDMQFIPEGAQSQNGVAAIYMAGNNMPFGSNFDNLKGLGFQYGIVQGPASYGQHGVAAVGPTGIGNTYHNMHFFDAFPLSFVDMQSTVLDDLNMNSTMVSPYDGTNIGSATCLQEGYTLDEQTGGQVTTTQFNRHTAYACEPENGSHIVVPPSVIIDSSHASFDTANFEGSFNVFAGDHLKLTNSTVAIPSINYGSNNDFGVIANVGAFYSTNVWNASTPELYNWGINSTCSVTTGSLSGPPVSCFPGAPQGYSGRSISSSVTGTKEENPEGGKITPGEWNTNGSFDSHPMSLNNVVDPTEPAWGRYAACNMGGAAICAPGAFDGQSGYIYIGAHQRIADEPYVAKFDLMSATAGGQVQVTISAFDSGTGQCSSSGSIASGTYTTTTSWPSLTQPFTLPVDFTGHAGCILSIELINATTTDQYRVGYFNFVPATNGTQTVCTAAITLSGSLTTLTHGTIGTATCAGALTTDRLVCATPTDIFSVSPFTPSSAGTPTMALQIAAGTININAENNTVNTATFSGPTYNCAVYR